MNECAKGKDENPKNIESLCIKKKLKLFKGNVLSYGPNNPQLIVYSLAFIDCFLNVIFVFRIGIGFPSVLIFSLSITVTLASVSMTNGRCVIFVIKQYVINCGSVYIFNVIEVEQTLHTFKRKMTMIVITRKGVFNTSVTFIYMYMYILY